MDCDVLCHLDAVLRHLPGINFNETINARSLPCWINSKQREQRWKSYLGFDYRGSAFPAPWIITEALARGIPCRPVRMPINQATSPLFRQLPAYLGALRPRNRPFFLRGSVFQELTIKGT
jgi:histidinol-phosphatase (PHP family)